METNELLELLLAVQVLNLAADLRLSRANSLQNSDAQAAFMKDTKAIDLIPEAICRIKAAALAIRQSPNVVPDDSGSPANT